MSIERIVKQRRPSRDASPAREDAPAAQKQSLSISGYTAAVFTVALASSAASGAPGEKKRATSPHERWQPSMRVPALTKEAPAASHYRRSPRRRATKRGPPACARAALNALGDFLVLGRNRCKRLT